MKDPTLKSLPVKCAVQAEPYAKKPRPARAFVSYVPPGTDRCHERTAAIPVAAAAVGSARQFGFRPYTSTSPLLEVEPGAPPVLLPRVPTYTLPLATVGTVNFTA